MAALLSLIAVLLRLNPGRIWLDLRGNSRTLAEIGWDLKTSVPRLARVRPRRPSANLVAGLPRPTVNYDTSAT